MNRPALTAKQKRIVDVIKSHIAEKSYPPSIREIGRALGGISTNGVTCHLALIEKKGWIARDRYVSRGIRVLP